MKMETALLQLLIRHNCVILPGFGGFVAQTKSAQIDWNSGVIYPPSKSLLFNRQLLNNDGLLINHLAQIEALTYERAQEWVMQELAEWRSQLQDGKRVELDKIGHLYLDGERNIQFEQDRFFNLLMDSFGLESVRFVVEELEHATQPEMAARVVAQEPIIEREESTLTEEFSSHRFELKKEEAQIPSKKEVEPLTQPEAIVIPLSAKQNDQSEVQEDSFDSRKAVWRYIAAAALLPVAFYTYWLPMKTNVLESGLISIHDFNPNYSAKKGIYQKQGFSFSLKKEKEDLPLEKRVEQLPTDVSVYYMKFADDLYIPVAIDQTTSPETEKVNEKVEPSEMAADVLMDSEKKVKNPEVLDGRKPTETVSNKNKANRKEEEKKATPKPETAKTQEVKSTVSGKKSHLIVGCFSTAENANTLVAELKGKGLNAELVHGGGNLYRVSAGAASSFEDMNGVIADAKKAGYTGWVLK